MQRQEMKRILKKTAKPIKRDLFSEVEFTEEEMKLMKFLYMDRVNQYWASDELGISIPTLTKLHNNCIDQLITYYNYEKYKMDQKQTNSFQKYFNLV